jgi:hypothetical protein
MPPSLETYVLLAHPGSVLTTERGKKRWRERRVGGEGRGGLGRAERERERGRDRDKEIRREREVEGGREGELKKKREGGGERERSHDSFLCIDRGMSTRKGRNPAGPPVCLL